MRFMHFVRPLARLFRAAPPIRPAPVDRVAALDTGSPELIIATALGDGAETLRAAAVRKLPDGDVLRMLAGFGDGASPPAPSSLERVARVRMAQLIDAGALDFAELCSSTENVAAILAVAGFCGNPAHLPQALALIDDPHRVAALVTEGSSSRVRQLAAESIQDPAQLKQLLKQVRGKDKSVYKIIKQKCDVLRAEEQRIAQIDSDSQALCAALERHSRRDFDTLYTPSFEQLDARWRTLEAQAAAALRERADQAIDRCREVIAGQLRQVADRAAEASHQAAHQAEQRAARDEAVARATAEAQLRNEATALAVAEAAKLREAEERARAERHAAEGLVLRQIGGLMAKANSALRDGNTGRAAGLRRAIEEKLPTVPVVPAYLAGQVQQLDAKLNELKEWKDYAVAPKRAELIADMEALIGSSEAPEDLARRVKALQDEWKTISKGIVSDSEADWQRFHQASLTAYQPCREYFEAQARLRQENMEKRKDVLERLRAFETAQGGENPDWRAVAVVLREARQEWRRFFPVDRAAGLAIQEGFDVSIGRLQARLDAWYAQNVADKKSLIQRAQQLRAKEDSREAVDAVKSLQLLWKNVGGVQRDQEQPLWEEFREQCDAIYQKRHQAFAEYTASLEANKAKAMALCQEAEQVAALSGPALLEGAGQIPQWRAAFETLSEMPRADERGLHDRFERALNLCQARVAQQRAHEKQQSFTDLLEAARRIQAYAWAVAQSGASQDGASLDPAPLDLAPLDPVPLDPAPLDPASQDRASRGAAAVDHATSADRHVLKQAAETFIAGVPQWPKGGAQALKEAWLKADTAAGLDAAAHETALRMLCIRSEILTNHPTPPEDQALRRDHQVQRLVQRMGQRNDANADELDALAFEWVRVGPVPAATYDALLARFLHCRRSQR